MSWSMRRRSRRLVMLAALTSRGCGLAPTAPPRRGLAHPGSDQPTGRRRGALAQLVERCLCKADVRSSNLLGSTAVFDRVTTLRSAPIAASGTLWPVTTSPIATATATLHTNRGDIKIALFGNHAPKTVANFVGLAQGTKEYSTQNASGEQRRAVLRRRGLPPRHRRLHDPGRRSRPAPAAAARATSSPTSSIPSCSSTSPTCWRWPTPARAPTDRSSSSPSARRRT